MKRLLLLVALALALVGATRPPAPTPKPTPRIDDPRVLVTVRNTTSANVVLSDTTGIATIAMLIAPAQAQQKRLYFPGGNTIHATPRLWHRFIVASEGYNTMPNFQRTGCAALRGFRVAHERDINRFGNPATFQYAFEWDGQDVQKCTLTFNNAYVRADLTIVIAR